MYARRIRAEDTRQGKKDGAVGLRGGEQGEAQHQRGKSRNLSARQARTAVTFEPSHWPLVPCCWFENGKGGGGGACLRLAPTASVQVLACPVLWRWVGLAAGDHVPIPVPGVMVEQELGAFVREAEVGYLHGSGRDYGGCSGAKPSTLADMVLTFQILWCCF